MKSNEKTLERLVRRVLKGQGVEASELLLHWESAKAGMSLIRLLNRQDGWPAFVAWAAGQAALDRKVRQLAETPGVPASQNDLFRQHGLLSDDTSDSGRVRAQSVAQAIAENRREDWDRAVGMMRNDPSIFEGALILLEAYPSADTVAFLDQLREQEGLSKEQQQMVRKLLYRLKQLGQDVATESGRLSEPELFAFVENRLPLWQMAFYFRSHSPFGGAGDLYILRFMDGQDFEQPEQEPNVMLDAASLAEIGAQYSKKLQEQIGLEIPFRIVPAPHARYLFHRTLSTLTGTNEAAERRLADFLRFVGKPEGSSDPFADLSGRQMRMPGAEQTAMLLQLPHFRFWFLDSARLQPFYDEMQHAQAGPIILTEYQQRERRAAAAVQAIRNYFDDHQRIAWSLAFEKAAFFIKGSRPEAVEDAWAISRVLLDFATPVDSIPATVQLFERTLAAVEKQRQTQAEEEKRGSLIVTPDEFARQQQERDKRRK